MKYFIIACIVLILFIIIRIIIKIKQDKNIFRLLKDNETNDKLIKAKKPAGIKTYAGLKGQSFDYPPFPRIVLSLAGDWQPENASLALEAVGILRGRYRISDRALLHGLKETKWEGRFEILRKRPLLIADGAHNPDAAAHLRATLELYLKEERMIFIIGMLRDKDAAGIFECMLPLAEQVITFTPPGNPRAMDAVELAGIAGKYHERVSSADSLEEALEIAELMAGKDGAVIAFGSLSFIGRLKELV